MMNLLGLVLVLSSLVTATLFSPTPSTTTTAEDAKKQRSSNVVDREELMGVKEGGRVIIMEYEREGSKQDTHHDPQQKHQGTVHSVLDEKLDAERRLARAITEEIKSVLPDERKWHPRELICDAFGKCKHKLAGAFHQGKDKITEMTHRVEEEAKGIGGAVKEKTEEMAHQAGEELIPQTKQRAEQLKEIVKHKSKDIAEEAKTAHHALWDERSVQRKVTGLLKEARVNITQYFKPKIESTVSFAALHTNSAMEFVHLLGFSIAYGVSIWVTFISSYVLADALPQQQLAMVQSKIYPVYFRTTASSITCALLAHCVIKRNYRKAEALQMSNLFVALLLVTFNMFYLEPRATKVMFDRMKLEKEEGSSHGIASDLRGGGSGDGGEDEQRRVRTGEMNRRLNKLNRASSVLNVMSLMGLSCHLVYLTHLAIMAQRSLVDSLA